MWKGGHSTCAEQEVCYKCRAVGVLQVQRRWCCRRCHGRLKEVELRTWVEQEHGTGAPGLGMCTDVCCNPVTHASC